MVLQNSAGRVVRTPQPLHVYVSRPATLAGVTVLRASDNDAVLLFNLPCTIAGGKGTVHIDAKSLVDTGCGTLSLLSQKAASRLALKLQPCSETFALADGTPTQCIGQTTLRVTIQSHTFTVRAFVVNMNDAFDLILGQQWLKDHRAVIDYDQQTLAVKKGSTSCTLRTPRNSKDNRAQAADTKHRRQKPITAAAVARHLRKGGKVYEFRMNAGSADSIRQGMQHALESDGTAETPVEHQDRIDRIMTQFSNMFVDELPANQNGPQGPELAQDCVTPP